MNEQIDREFYDLLVIKSVKAFGVSNPELYLECLLKEAINRLNLKDYVNLFGDDFYLEEEVL